MFLISKLADSLSWRKLTLKRLFLSFRRTNLRLHAFSKSNTFISNARLKLTKNQVNAKQHPEQHPETELLLFENYLHFSFMLSKKIGHTLKNKEKNKCVCIHEIIWLLIMEMKMKKESTYHIDTKKNRLRSRQRHKHSQYKKRLRMIIFICLIHLSNT